MGAAALRKPKIAKGKQAKSDKAARVSSGEVLPRLNASLFPALFSLVELWNKEDELLSTGVGKSYLNEQWTAPRGSWPCSCSQAADFTFLAFSVDCSRQELAQEAESSPRPAHTIQPPEIFHFWAQHSHKSFYLKLCQTRAAKTQKASLVLSPAIANLCHKLINTALSGVLHQSVSATELFKSCNKILFFILGR